MFRLGIVWFVFSTSCEPFLSLSQITELDLSRSTISESPLSRGSSSTLGRIFFARFGRTLLLFVVWDCGLDKVPRSEKATLSRGNRSALLKSLLTPEFVVMAELTEREVTDNFLEQLDVSII